MDNKIVLAKSFPLENQRLAVVTKPKTWNLELIGSLDHRTIGHLSMLCWSAAQQQNNVKLFREIKKYHFVDLSRLVIMGSGAGGHIATRVLSEDSG